MSIAPHAIGFLIIAISTSSFLNCLVIVCMIKKKTPISIRDIIIISLATSDLLQSIVGYSAQLYNAANEGNTGIVLCRFAGFVITFTSLSSIYHLVALMIERYCSIAHALFTHQFLSEPLHSVYFVLIAWVQGLFWAGAPLFGWGGYHREPQAHHRCSVVLANKSTVSMSYSYGLMISNYFLPIIIILFCCLQVQREIRRMTERSIKVTGNDSSITQSTQKAEKQHFIMICVINIAFFIAWTPYAICVIWFTVYGNINGELMAASALFAKFSVFSNPIIYSIFYKEFRTTVKRLFCSPSEVVPVD